jgi:hypothetical protein
MPDDLYKGLMKHEKKCTGLKWFCKVCEQHFGKIRIEVKVLAEKQILLEAKQETMDKSVLDIKKEVIELKKQLEDQVHEGKHIAESNSDMVVNRFEEIKGEISEIKKSYSSMLQVGITASAESAGNISSVPSRNIKIEVSEVMEREKRKNNLVIFGIDETNDEFATKDRVKEIISAVGLEENKVKYFGRVGRNATGPRPRSVRVVCEDAETKRSFLKSAFKLKTIEGYANIYVSSDLTKMQQIQDKKLRDKLKEIRLSNRDAKINNGEIVIFEDGYRKILFTQQQ